MSTTTATLGAGVASEPRMKLFRRLYYGQTRFDFVRRKKIWFAVSALLILAGAVSLGTRGLNFDIEFVGGTSWQVPANGATTDQAKTALAHAGLGNATITSLGSGNNQQISVQAKLGASKNVTDQTHADQIALVLAHLTHHQSINSVTIQQVGPTWGGQITHKAVLALIVFFILIAIYISIFFEWKMAIAAIIAVIHDILVTVGIYSLTSFLVTPDTVVAFLTILGYSLYDTIVVFDRIRDNTKGIGASGKLSFTDVVNLSMNQTLARSINTSLVAILPILAVLVLGANVLGATTLQYFGLALLIGLASGAYSSIFIASPLVAILKEREPRFRAIAQRLESRGTGTMLLSPAAVAAGALTEREDKGGGARRKKKGSAQVSSGPLRPGNVSSAAPGGGVGIAVLDDDDESVLEPEAVTDDAPANGTSKQPASRGTGSGSGAARGSGSGATPARKPNAPRPGQPRPRKKRRR